MGQILLLTFDPHRDLESWGQHVSLIKGEEPVEALCIARKRDNSVKPAAYIIPLDNLFKFAAPDSPSEEFELIESCMAIATILECPTEDKHLMRIAMYIQDNIYKVFNIKPYDLKDGKKIADVEGTLNGESFTSEVRSH